MASGERSQVWFPELVEILRQSWLPELDWPAIIALRDQLQRTLDGVRTSRGIRPVTLRCPECGRVGPAAEPSISVRALLLALRRFGIESHERVRSLEHEWARHRATHDLDLYGRSSGQTVGPGQRHSHT